MADDSNKFVDDALKKFGIDPEKEASRLLGSEQQKKPLGFSMSQEDAAFWFGIGVFTTGLFVVFDHWFWGALMIFAGGLPALWAARQHYGRFAILVGLMLITWAVVAYDIYDRHEIEPSAQPQPSGASSQRTLNAIQKQRIQVALQLSPNENYTFQINSAPNCDECEVFAEKIRGFINTIPGWQAGGGPLTFFEPKQQYGMWLIFGPDDQNSTPVTKLQKGFSSAGIPLVPDTEPNFPKGQFVIVIARQRAPED